MRHPKASSSGGKLNRRWWASRQELLLVVLLGALGLWILWSFAQELSVSHRLSAQAALLEQQNASLQAENDGYRQDIAAIQSGGGAEEEARLNGYARSDEKLYLISAPPAPPAPAKVVVKVDDSSWNPVDSMRRWLTDHWHR